ncbi:hypothetical protein COCNU_07G007830 [Cocos nucifera]|uniref:Uncharacterized protein n=1 Tax=Cocos nucifera TaxID=13894 RepID=A0A8K0IF45_COCNU|nr:hypothetical protein COCNU_07G007830 [Cocos nucifera]
MELTRDAPILHRGVSLHCRGAGEEVQEDIARLDTKLALSRGKVVVGKCKGVIFNLEKEIILVETTFKETEEKQATAKKAAWALEEEVSTTEVLAQEFASRSIADYRTSREFEDEVIEGSIVVYKLAFVDCKATVNHLHPDLDLSGIEPEEDAKEDGREDSPTDLEVALEAEAYAILKADP